MDIPSGAFAKAFQSMAFGNLRFLSLAECSGINDTGVEALTLWYDSHSLRLQSEQDSAVQKEIGEPMLV